LLLPGAMIALIGAHLYLVVKLGTTAPPWVKAERPKSIRTHELTAIANRAGAETAAGNGAGQSAPGTDGADE
ncbi:MAG: hypothetical protein ACXWW8_05745, partial [Solirubrobacterales bacterium]